MSKIEKYLSAFNDSELAFFAKFMRSTYLKPTQSKIDKILFKRGMTNQKIESLIQNIEQTKQKDGDLRCPRCGSKNIRTDKVEKHRPETGGSSLFAMAPLIDKSIKGKAVYDFEIICNVCGFWLKDPNEERKKSYSSKLINWISDLINGKS